MRKREKQLIKYQAKSEVLEISTIKIDRQLSRLRRQKRITQGDLGDRLGVTAQAVSKWETGQCYPDIQLLPDIANFFGVTVDELLGYRI